MAIRDDVLKAPEVEDDPSGYIDTLITQAEAFIQGYTKNEDWPDVSGAEDPILDAACVRLVLHYYRMGGAEGTVQVTVGDVNMTHQSIPPEVKKILDCKRRTGWL